MNKKNLALALLLTLGLSYGNVVSAGCSSCGGCSINEPQPEKERKSACGSGNCGFSGSCVAEENDCKPLCGGGFCGDKKEKVEKKKNNGGTKKRKTAGSKKIQAPAPDADAA